jgi:DNA-binding transcriptional LysR family regulator
VEFRHLRAFVAVAEELHFGRAARRLYVAQPAVSQLVRSLEAELGVTLFERTSRRVSLTWAGQVLLDEARDLLARQGRLAERMARVGAGQSGEVGLGIVPALPPDLIPALLADLRARLPDVRVVARSLPSGLTASAALERPDVDVALLRSEAREPGISTIEVAREPVGVALPSTDALADRPSLVATDLEGRAFVAFPRDDDPVEFDRIFGALRASGLRSLAVHESPPGGVEASLRLVGSDIAVSLKLESEVRAHRDDLVVWRPLDDPVVEVVITAAWRPDRLGPAGRRLVDILGDRQAAVGNAEV